MENENIIKVQDKNLEKGEQIVKMLEQFGLFWNVVKKPLFIADGSEDDTKYTPTNYFATQRDDTGKVFTTVKDGYRILQNWELCELIQEVAGDFNLEVAKGGSLQGGAKVFVQIATGQIQGLGENNDTVKKWITAINSHDGTCSLAYGKTSVTISCSNTFHMANRQLSSKIRHTMSMKDKLSVLRSELSEIQEQEQTLYNMFFKMADRPASIEDVKKVVMQSTAVNLDTSEIEAKTLYSTQQINKAKALSIRISEEMASKGDSLWGLFSGVTKYTNRDLTTPKRENGVLESKILGGANRLDNKVFAELTSELV